MPRAGKRAVGGRGRKSAVSRRWTGVRNRAFPAPCHWACRLRTDSRCQKIRTENMRPAHIRQDKRIQRKAEKSGKGSRRCAGAVGGFHRKIDKKAERS